MERTYLIKHLEEQGCYTNGEAIENVGEIWYNCINGELCNIPFAEHLEVPTYCHVIYQLRIDPPRENGYDSDYDVYVGFKEHQRLKAEAEQH